MDEVVDCTQSFAERCRAIFDTSGPLVKAIPDFSPRSQQVELALGVVRAISECRSLVAEAGTGTGKTFAYLVPSLLSGKKVLISTATKTLQDQLFQKDLPILARALGRSVRVQNLKGRSNYLCRQRIHQQAEEGRLASLQVAEEVRLIHERLPKMKHGERHELPEIPEDSGVWPFVTSTTDNCLGTECAYYESCFLVKARRRALEADIVVINHHLYFADSRLKDEGFSELLPGVEVMVFDEAHHLAGIAESFYGHRLGTGQIKELVEDLIKEWPAHQILNPLLEIMRESLDALTQKLIAELPTRDERVSFDEIRQKLNFQSAWNELLEVSEQLILILSEISTEHHPGLARCKTRTEEIQQFFKMFVGQHAEYIRWVESFRHNLVFHATPLDVSQLFYNSMKHKKCAYIFTSATLTMADSFDCFNKPLGLKEVETLILPSPFDFKKQALLYLPRSIPDPKDARYNEALLARALPIIEACGGRCFFLFTSHRALKQVAEQLAYVLNFPLLIQGQESKPILLARFREYGNAVLLGTATFWEGVDVKGEALSCVIIDKLPFASPADPIMRGKMAHYQSRGLSSFDELSLPSAILSLKQGVGRLIRDVQDKGVIMLADPRLTSREYARLIFKSLPPMRKTRDEDTAIAFINQLALTHEITSD